MRRISLLSTVVISSALAIAAIAASPASAAGSLGVFCKTAPVSHECGGSVYPAGTEINASLNGPLTMKTGGGTTVFQCYGSDWKMKVGESTYTYIKTTALSFSSCNTPFTVPWVGATDLSWTEGTDNGKFGSSRAAEVQFKFLGVTCTLYFDGPGTYAGPGELVGGSSPKMVYKNDALPGVTGGFCPNVVYATGEYKISTPTPLYVEKP